MPWKLRSITEEENQECRKAATRKVKGKNGLFTPEIDPNDYMAKLMVSSVIFPDLKITEMLLADARTDSVDQFLFAWEGEACRFSCRITNVRDETEIIESVVI